jgi:hypothetical protein
MTYESLSQFEDALADYEEALRDDDINQAAIEAGRQRCLIALAQ